MVSIIWGHGMGGVRKNKKIGRYDRYDRYGRCAAKVVEASCKTSYSCTKDAQREKRQGQKDFKASILGPSLPPNKDIILIGPLNAPCRGGSFNVEWQSCYRSLALLAEAPLEHNFRYPRIKELL